jgi:tRNA-splicing ligase RtcB
MRSGLSREEAQPRIKALVDGLFRNIPSGVGSSRKDLKLGAKELAEVMQKGVQWAVARGFGTAADRSHIEAEGCIKGADPEKVGERAVKRGQAQLGTLGSGNHFIEIDYVDEVFDKEAASVFGLQKDQVAVLIHTGSRGFGHQICDDYIKVMLKASNRYGIELPDRQLCCAPVNSEEGRDYMGAMACAANFGFVNRQVITHWVRETFEKVFEMGPKDLRLSLVYDVCHNIAKMEVHQVDGQDKKLCVHRKGATRAFPPGHREIPDAYRKVGQPVLIPGDMGRSSYVLVGTEKAYQETFGSTCHGSGRLLSRHQSKKAAKGRAIAREMEDLGIVVRGASKRTLVEEIPEAYKDVEDVVHVVHGAGISKKVVRLKPMGVIKG